MAVLCCRHWRGSRQLREGPRKVPRELAERQKDALLLFPEPHHSKQHKALGENCKSQDTDVPRWQPDVL